MRQTTPGTASTDIGDLQATLIALSPLGLMLSSQRKILLCNTAFAHLFGYQIGEMQGVRSSESLIHLSTKLDRAV